VGRESGKVLLEKANEYESPHSGVKENPKARKRQGGVTKMAGFLSGPPLEDEKLKKRRRKKKGNKRVLCQLKRKRKFINPRLENLRKRIKAREAH